jgi:hypothetical protein
MMPDTQPPVDRTPRTSTMNRITLVFAAFGVLAFLALTTVVLHAVGLIQFDLYRVLSDSDEAPIRVRNGSADFVILAGQHWEQIGTSGSWRIAAARRRREEFEVTVATKPGATCGGALTATGSDIVIIYENDDNPETTNTSRIVMQSAGRRTVVKPDNGVTLTWDKADPPKLSYKVNGGFIRSIAVGNGANPATICSFSSAAQLDHMIILNVP